MQGRCQQVVDLTNPEAYDYVYDCMDKLVEELGIDYIKWDHNKLVTEAFSPRETRVPPCMSRRWPSTASSAI